MLSHKSGGTITALTAIGHTSYKGVAEWHYVGRVEWKDGTVSESITIAPWAVCYDHDNTVDQAQYKVLSDKLNDYLNRHGKWLDQPKKVRGGYLVHWVPSKLKFEESLKE